VTDSSPTSRAFDHHAGAYAARWDENPLVREMRARVIARCIEYFRPGSHVADLGCGTGEDASALQAAGLRVSAFDVSDGMVSHARARGVDARRLGLEDVEGAFDGALSNFGALNCLDRLDGLAVALRRCLTPGGTAVLVTMSPRCPAEDVALLARGRRTRRGARVPVEGVEVPVRWWARRELEQALQGFRLLHLEGLGVLVPPPDLGGRPGLFARLDRLAGRAPALRHLGDHTLTVWRRS
jgi:SAM-dependent methyltransferase